MSAVHLIKGLDPKLPKILPDKQRGDDVLYSGDWQLSEERARLLIGGKVYFHRRQTSPSFLGGTVIDVEDSSVAGRFVFFFKVEQECRGVVTPREGWAMEMKYVP